MKMNIAHLLSLSNDEIEKFKGKTIEIYLKNGEEVLGQITGFECAANRGNLICTFILENRKVHFSNVVSIIIE